MPRQYDVLNRWADQAEEVNDRWATLSPAQKDAVMREAVQRLGLLCRELSAVLRRVTYG
jgi:hypothetical protein